MADDSEFLLNENNDKNTEKLLNYFWVGFIIYSASYTITTTTAVNYIICQFLQILGIVLFVTTSIMLIKWRFDSRYLKIIYFIYCFWLTTVMFRGFSFEYSNLKLMLFDAEFGIFRYFAPLILLFPKNLEYLKKVFNVIIILGIFFIAYDILFLGQLLDLNYDNESTKFTFEYFTKTLSVSCGFILLTFYHHTNRRNLFAFIVISLSIGFAIYRARRALIFMIGAPLLISYLLFFYTSKRKFIVLFFSVILGYFLILYGVKFYNQNKNDVFTLITDRITEDTRSGVETYFYNDMNAVDWAIGKGINGKYFCPDTELSDLTGHRSKIETDYLNIILKGGLISLVLLILIIVPAIIKGIFYSKNTLSKAAAFWILIWSLNLYPAIVNSFSLNHLLVWISIGICYSEKIRNLPETYIVNQFLPARKNLTQSN